MILAYQRDGFDIYRVERWGYYLAAIIIAALAASLAYRFLDIPQSYESPIVGSVAWNFSNKFQDYALLFVLVGAFFASLTGISLLANRLVRIISPEAEENLHRLTVLLCTPAAFWFAALLTTKNASLNPLYFSAALLMIMLTLSTVMSWKGRNYWDESGAQFGRILQKILLMLFCTVLAGAAVGVFISRGAAILETEQLINSNEVRTLCIGLAAAAILLVSAAISWSKIPAVLERRFNLGIQVLQSTFPLFFLLLIPTPWQIEKQLSIGYPMSVVAWIVIGACITLSAADLIRRFLLNRNLTEVEPARLFSIFCVVGVLLFLKAAPASLPIIPGDDYHFGEMLVPWWTWTDFGMVPFWDFAPARGLNLYLPGAAASTLFDGTAAIFQGVYPFLFVAYLLVVLTLLSRAVGLGIAALAFFLVPTLNGLSEIHFIVTAFLCVLCLGCLKWNPPAWVLAWLVSVVGIILFAPGQGALVTLATAPIALYMAWQGFLRTPYSMFKVIFLFLALALVLGLATPLGKMFFAAIRYGAEQSSINSAAHSIAWRHSFPSKDTNPWMFEMVRASWLIVTLWAGALILKLRSPRWSEIRSIVIVFAVPIFLLGVLFIIRAAGRIDFAGPTRLGFASIWALSLLLPLLLFANKRNRKNTSLVFTWVALAGLIFPYFGGIRDNFAWSFDPIPLPGGGSGLTVGSEVGLPKLGTGTIAPDQLNRLVSVNKLLESVLDQDETYLDMSGRGAQYFYLQRKPPIQTGSVYNLVGEAQQLRAIAALKRQQPKAILIGANNLKFDGGPASLRSPLLYRFVMLQSGFVSANVDGFDWLVSKERVDRLPKSGLRRISEVDDALPSSIHNLFKTTDLRFIPASWGRSASSLEPNMKLVRPVDKDLQPGLNSVDQIDNGHFLVTGADPYVRYDLSGWKLSGRDAGVLGFDFFCEISGPVPIIEIFWASSRNHERGETRIQLNGVDGRLIVPLDADPAWLLAEEIKSLRFDVLDQSSCKSFKIEDIELFQRAQVNTAD
jgi:hypothetical protein